MSCDLQMRHHHHPLRRGPEVWLPIRAKGWKWRAQNRLSQFAIQPSVDEHPQAGLALHQCSGLRQAMTPGKVFNPPAALGLWSAPRKP